MLLLLFLLSNQIFRVCISFVHWCEIIHMCVYYDGTKIKCNITSERERGKKSGSCYMVEQMPEANRFQQIFNEINCFFSYSINRMWFFFFVVLYFFFASIFFFFSFLFMYWIIHWTEKKLGNSDKRKNCHYNWFEIFFHFISSQKTCRHTDCINGFLIPKKYKARNQ